jgi:hypothetical protein
MVGRAPALPASQTGNGALKTKEHAMSERLNSKIAVIGIDIGKNSFHIVGQDRRGALVLRQKWSRGQVEARLANLPNGCTTTCWRLRSPTNSPASPGRFSITGVPSSTSRQMQQRPDLLDPRAVLKPVKAWPGNTGASRNVIATASLDGPLRATPLRTRRPGRTNGRQARTKEQQEARRLSIT